MKISSRISVVPAILAACIFTGCKNQIDEITELDLSRCLEPMTLNAKIAQGNQVTFSWDVTKDAEQYALVVCTDKEMTQEYLSETISASEVPYTKALEADATYYYKVRALSKSKDASKWAVYEKAINTYAVKDNLFLEVTQRQDVGISLAWSSEVSDYLDVDRIVYGLPGAEEDAQKTKTLSDEEKQAAKASVDGLSPGTEYIFTLYYKSASRGEVDVWTAPSTTGFTEVSSVEGLENALKSAGAKVLLKMSGSPYTYPSDQVQDIVGAVTVCGEASADGSKPVVNGEFHITSAFNGGEILFEDVELNGQKNTRGFTIQLKNGGGIKNDVAIDAITFRNCTITGYSKGLLYEWGQPMNVGKLNWESCDINNINADGTGGGDVIDIRGTAASPLSTLGDINLINNTLSTGGRTYLRIDFPKSLGKIRIENNTVYNICLSDNTNNVGIIGLQTKPSEMTVKNNLFIGMGEKSKLGSDGTAKEGGFNGMKYLGSGEMTFSGNWYYDVSSTFFNTNFTQSDAASGGGGVLSEDPCYNAKAGEFNLTNTDLCAAKVGASKWWVPYVEKTEDLTLGTIQGNKTWDFGDAKLFSGTIKSERVRDLLYINASSGNAITVENEMMNFAAATVTTRKGVPTNGYFCFKVTRKGSVLVKVEDPQSYGNHVVVGVGPVDGSAITIKGGASAMSDMANAQKILISDISQESMVYVYVSGPVSIGELAWSTDTTTVNTALPTPAPSADPQTVTVGDATDINISWEEVANAASYSVVFKGKTFSVEEGTTYTIGATTVGMLDAGIYKVEVYANPGEDDIYNTESAAGVAAFAVQPKSDGGGSGELVVKDSESLLAAIGAGKSEITLAPGTFSLTDAIVVSAPLALKGQEGAVMEGASFKLTGADAGSFSLEGLTLKANGQGILVDFDVTGPATLSSVLVKDCVIDGYSKSAIYSSAASNSVENLEFRGVTVKNQGTGQGGFDFRKGNLTNVKIVESTFNGGFRDFIRMDAAVVCSVLDISHNTFYNVSNNASNSLLYVRAAAGSYTVNSNLFHSLNVLMAKTGTTVPSMSGNYYYGCDAKLFTGTITEETAKGGNGVVLSSEPCKDAANGDFTLVNALAISEEVGAPVWCPSSKGESTASFTVASVEEYTAAVEAGKTDIKFALSGSPYDLSEAALTLPSGVRLSGETSETAKPVVKVAQLNISGEAGQIILENLNFEGTSANNFLNVADAAVASAVIVRNCSISGPGKSVFYDSIGASIESLVFSNVKMSNLGGGQGTVDIRKGSYNTISLKNCTIVGGRDLIRADAGLVKGAVNISGNTFDGVNLNNGNGVLYVRSTPESFVVNNNLFLNENGGNCLLSKAAGITVPGTMNGNWFYGCTSSKWWTGMITKEIATAGGGELAESPVADAANGDYTLTNADLKSAKVGAECWIK